MVWVSDALRRFKVEREQMALVVEEHGAVAGMVTVSGWTIEVLAAEHHAITSARLPRGSGQGQVGRDLEGDGDQGVDAGGDRGQ
jgi:hypothetical protein